MSDDARTTTPAAGAPAEHRLRAHRCLIHGVLVAIDAPAVSSDPWVVDGLDLTSQGMGLVLPPEIPEGTEVLLSFRLSDEIEFSRVPAVVRHQEGSAGGVVFEPWSAEDRQRLLEYLVWFYENRLAS